MRFQQGDEEVVCVLISESELLICEFCGEEIIVPGQRCPALDDGRCQP